MVVASFIAGKSDKYFSGYTVCSEKTFVVMEVKNKMKTKIFGLILSLVLIASMTAFSFTASAKDMKLPPGADVIVNYFGGNASIDLPAGLPNYPSSATMISFSAYNGEGNLGAHVTLLVQMYMTTSRTPTLHWEPIAQITTGSPDFLSAFWKGTQIAFDATLYGFPSSYSTNNVIPVSDQVLTAERHGNSMYITLKEPQQVQLFGYPTKPPTFTLPAFSMVLNKCGDSVHFEKAVTLSGFLGASGYTQDSTVMGFQATGAFTCTNPGWNYHAAPMTDPFITKQGLQTYYPPSFGNTNVGTYQDGNDAHAKSASYFICSHTGTITDIFAYVARVGTKGDGAAAIYADNGGSPGALIAATDKARVGTSFSWVDFKLSSPVSVTSGTGYWLAISSNNALNLNIVVGSGVRVHNGISSWFSNPFGPVWGTHDAGAMSIYATGLYTQP